MKKYFFLMIIASMTLQSCCKSAIRKDNECEQVILIYKFKPGKDYSRYATHGMFNPQEDHYYHPDLTGYRPMSLHDGYYTGGNVAGPAKFVAERLAYLTITLDEMEENDSLFNEWKYNWENYILDEDPFEELYVGDNCNKNLQTLYADSCIAGYEKYQYSWTARLLDSNDLNRIIDNMQLNDYFTRIK